MTRNIRIAALWLLTICGFVCHTLCDILPMFWGKDMAIVATDGNADYGMIVFMMTLSYLLPAGGVLSLFGKARHFRIANAVLALLITLFNVVHAFMELPSDNAGQYVVMPLMIAIGLLLSWQSILYLKEE